MNIKKKILNLPVVKRLQTEYIGLQYRNEEKRKHNNYESLIIPEGKNKPLISIIILNHNGKKNFEILMPSLDKCIFYDNYELIIVDNASTDDSISYIEQWKNRFDIKIIRNESNESFSAANNKGAKEAKGDYLLFLNNDVKVTDGWLDELLKLAFDKENVGAVGAKLIYPKLPDDSINAGKSYMIQHAGVCFRDKIREKLYFIQPYNMGNGKKDYAPVEGCIERPCISAAVMLVSKDVFDKVNGFDEKYIYGYEDVDICLKLYKEGYHNYYCADSFLYHYEFGTQEKDDDKEVKKRRLHNMEVFKGKWQRFLFNELYKDKLNNNRFFTEVALTIKLVLPNIDKASASDESASAQSEDLSEDIYTFIKGALTKKGYIIKKQNRAADKEYNIGVGTDVIICLDPQYDISKITNVKNDIVVVSWEDNSTDAVDGKLWKAQDYYDQYCYHLTDDLGNNDDKINSLTEYLTSLCNTGLNDKEIDICGAMPDNETTKFWGDYHYALALKNEFEKRGYKANILSRENWYNRSSAKYTIVLRGLRAYYPGMEDGRKFIMWNISHPADVTPDEYGLYDCIFYASKHMQKMYEGKVYVPSGVLPQCTDPDVMKSTDSGEKKYELLFVGNSRHVYRQILKDLLPTDHKLTVYGRHWEKFPVQEYVVNDYIDNNIVGQAYHDAKILLNDHWDDMKEYGIISNRIFDALSAEAFVISDDVPGLDEVLEGNVVTYTTPEDLKEKIDYYLSHDDERDAKAQAGKIIVRNNHTFANRVDEILTVVKNL